MMTMTTYPTTPERPVTRAEIDRLAAIIAGLNDARDLDAATIRQLRHEIDVQTARAAAAALALRNWPERGEAP